MAVLALMLAVLLTGCDSRPVSTALGSLAGIATLSEADAATGHAGILVYLAGTPFQARTDQQGRYRIDGIPAGSYDLIAEKAGYQGQIIEGLLINPDLHTTSAPLQPADSLLDKAPIETVGTSPTLGTVTGEVLLEGMPGENGGVRIEVDGTPFVTVSGNDGKYRMPNVEPGSYTLSYFRDGYLPFTSENVDITTGVNVVPDVALQLMQPGDPVSAGSVAESMAARAATPPEGQQEPPPGPDEVRTIVGIVELRDAAGQVVSDYSNVTVAINGTNLVADINDQGQFRFDNLTSGTYTLIGTIPDGPVVQIPVDLITQRVASVSVRLLEGDAGSGPGGTIRGRVILVDPDDEPMDDASGVKVAVNGTEVMATTAADGVFTLTGVPAGTYTLSATRDKYTPGEVAGVEVTAAAPVDVGEIRLVMDVDRPRVLSTSPENNERDVVVGFDLPITVKFSDRMNAASVRDAISLTPSNPFTAAIGRGTGPGADDDTLVITLSNDSAEAPIRFGDTYRVTIAATAANMDGVTMEEPYSFSFRTDKPGVIQVTPENGANQVYLDQIEFPVMFTFNTRLDPDSINSKNFRVRPDDGRSVSVTHTNSDANGWTTVRVATMWQPDTAYTVTVSRRVKASNGQTLGNTPYTLRFRTAPLEVMTMPMLEVR
jgi:hypothetical protein